MLLVYKVGGDDGHDGGVHVSADGDAVVSMMIEAKRSCPKTSTPFCGRSADGAVLSAPLPVLPLRLFVNTYPCYGLK